MAQFIRPPIADVPYGGSLGANLAGSIGEALKGFMAAHDAEEARKKEKLKTDMALRDLAVNEAMTLIPGDRPTVPEGGVMPVLTRTGGPLSPAGTEQPERRSVGGMTMPAPEPVGMTEIPGLTFGKREVVPPRSIPRLYEAEAIRKEAGMGQYAKTLTGEAVQITPEIWDKLPDLYKGLWPIGRTVDTKDVGAVGMKILADTQSRSEKVPVYDTTLKKDVLVSKTERDADTEGKYAPPQESRLASDADRDEARALRVSLAGQAQADRQAAREQSRADKKEVADAKAEEKASQVADYVKSLNEGQPVEVVPASMRGAVNEAYRKEYGSAPLNRYQIQQGGILDSLDGMITRIESDAEAVLKVTDDWLTRNVPGGVRLAGYAAKIRGSLGQAPEVVNLENTEAELSRLSRGLADERGNISDKDVARIGGAVPHTGDIRAEVVNKIKRLRAIVQERRHGLKIPAPTPASPAGMIGSKIGRFTVVGVE